MDYGDKVTMRQPRIFKHAMSLNDRASATETHPSFMALRAIPGAIEKQEQEILELEQESAAHAAYQMVTGNIDGMLQPEWVQAADKLDGAWSHLHRLQTEPYRRWANGFSCLCFALVGAAMAIRWRNADLLTSFFLCFLPILIVYYPLLMYGVDAAKNGRLPPTIVWLGNLILIIWGVWMMRRVIRN
jgi:lipopolysaccharide export system permease protein